MECFGKVEVLRGEGVGRRRKRLIVKKELSFKIILLFVVFSCFWVSCKFDYGFADGSGRGMEADLVMVNANYVRMKRGRLEANFRADVLRRYDGRGEVELEGVDFEYYTGKEEKLEAEGRAEKALYDMGSGDLRMDDGVGVEILSEEVRIGAGYLRWEDSVKRLESGKDDEVTLAKKDGSVMTGTGFRAYSDVKKWEMEGGASGIFVGEDEEEK